MTQFEDLIDRVQATTSLEEIQDLVVDIRDRFEVEHVVYHVVGNTGEDFGALTYDAAWVDDYIKERRFGYDPVVQESLRRFHPIDWQTLDWSGKRQKRLMSDAIDNGIGEQGLSVPIRGTRGKFALFSVTSTANDEKWEKFKQANIREILLASHYIHHRAIEVLQGNEGYGGQELSPREQDVLRMLALGQSRAQAADALKISEHTFRVYVDTARHKLGAQNTVHAVSLALTQGHVIL